VHDLEDRLRSPTKEISGEEIKLRSPFIDCDYLRIRALLQQMNTSLLATKWFLALYAESEKTFTGVIVHVKSDEDGGLSVESAHVVFGKASQVLLAANIAHPPLQEHVESDGVIWK
jgi:hypothetical protein